MPHCVIDSKATTVRKQCRPTAMYDSKNVMQAQCVIISDHSNNLDYRTETATAQYRKNGEKIAMTNIPQSTYQHPLEVYGQRNGHHRRPPWRPNTVKHVEDDAPPPTPREKTLGSTRRRGTAFQVRRRWENLEQVCENDDCDKRRGEVYKGIVLGERWLLPSSRSTIVSGKIPVPSMFSASWRGHRVRWTSTLWVWKKTEVPLLFGQ